MPSVAAHSVARKYYGYQGHYSIKGIIVAGIVVSAKGIMVLVLQALQC